MDDKSYEARRAIYSLANYKVKDPSRVPQENHWQVLVFSTSSVTIPGDERSRTNPGHGYPEHTETFSTVDVYAFKDQALWRKLIEALYTEDPKRTDVLAQEVAAVAMVKPTFNVSF